MSEKDRQNSDEGIEIAPEEVEDAVVLEPSCSEVADCENSGEESEKTHGENGKESHIAGTSKETRHKRSKRGSVKGLAELLKKKNEMLQGMGNDLEKATETIKLKEDRILRMAAEFENYKKRTRREWDLLQKKANADLLNDLLFVLDDFERAFEAAEDAGDHFFSGILMIHSRFVDILRRAGLSEIDAQGRPFDPQFHEALGEAESEEVGEGCVLNIVQKGYLLNDQILRPARVIIARKREQ